MANFYGGSGRDYLVGGSENDWFYGRQELDIIYGNGGDDFIDLGTGGSSTEVPWWDFLSFAGIPNSLVYGGTGNDIILAEASGGLVNTTHAYGEAGNDTIYDRFRSNDIFDGGSDTDTISYSFRSEGMRIKLNIDGETAGSARAASSPAAGELDTLYRFENAEGTEHNDAIWGNDGANILRGLGGDDVLIGYNGANTFYDGAGNDDVFGGIDMDRFYAESGTNKFYGSGGHDTLDYSQLYTARGIIFNESLNRVFKVQPVTLVNSSDYIFDIETISGTSYADSFQLTATTGLQVIIGQGGADIVRYFGSTVANVALDEPSAGTTHILIGIENVVGTTGTDRIQGNASSNHLDGGGNFGILRENLIGLAGDDVIVNTGRTYADGGEGNDRITLQNGSDYALGGAGNDTIYLGLNDDITHGGTGNDLLFGQDGNDKLVGGDGVDKISGGQGLDTLYGNAGVDYFVYKLLSDSTADSNRDVIMDFQRGSDNIHLFAIDANTSTSSVNDAFVFDTNGVFTAGEIRQQDLGSSILLSFYVNSDSTVDMQILLNNVASPLLSSDFIL
jgi:Ca2+-binding RTX toxin-like protein